MRRHNLCLIGNHMAGLEMMKRRNCAQIVKGRVSAYCAVCIGIQKRKNGSHLTTRTAIIVVEPSNVLIARALGLLTFD